MTMPEITLDPHTPRARVGPSIDALLQWMVENADREPSATVVLGGQKYHVRTWRNGVIAFRPVA